MSHDPSPPDAERAPTPAATGLAEPLRSRWSPSLFDDTHRLEAATLDLLLEAARWAPSRGNSQPWRLVVAERGDDVHRLLVPHLTRGNAGWVPRASAVLLAGADVEAPDTEPDAYHDLGQAAAHLTLQARALGLHAHQFAGYDHAAVARELDLPASVRLLTGIAVGVRLPAGRHDEVPERDRERDLRPRTRRPLDELVLRRGR